MRRTLVTCACAALTLVALAAAGTAAQAETKTLVSSEASSLCVNPTKGFKPKKNSKEINYAPLEESNPGGGPFPDTGKACEAGTPSHPAAMGAPGQPAGPYHGSIAGASWVSLVASGSDASNPPPRYYIYDATFDLCANQLAGASISGTMFADNIASAYLNGELIGRQPYAGLVENFNGPPAGGWPFGPASGPFRAGVNTLQFVVLDESTAYTGLDFSATVTAPSVECEASEFPGLGRCAKAKGGDYENSSCETQATGGSYEWLAGAAKNKFKSKEGLSTFTTVGAKTLTCKSDTDVGEYVGESEDLETITFKDCDIPGRECTNEPGAFATKPLRSLYGFITKPTVAGVSLEPV
ncbi:MAG TPA: hypothetical protein VED41_09045, partial [Solirubrobacteraceae bacterium]|nr:hypothetical protein [Solirubrobacteraceae bacterium]